MLTDPNDIPDWIKYPHGKKDDEQLAQTEDGIIITEKRRAAANATSYTDGLTEKQFLRMMEKQAQAEEDEAKARKLEWHLKRDKKAQEIALRTTESNVSSLNNSDLQPAANPLTNSVLDRLISITKCVIALREDKTKRRRSDIFREKPLQQEYPDYYRIIKKPIAINDIMKKCRSKQYEKVKEFADDWELMFENAKTFNGEESWIYADAKVLNSELQRLLEKNKPQLVDNVGEEETNNSSAPKKKTLKLKLSLKRKQADENDNSKPNKKRGKKSNSSPAKIQ